MSFLESIFSFIESIFSFINDATWEWALIPFLVVLGVFFTLTSGFVQFQFFGRMFRVLFPGAMPAGEGHVSSREALLVSVGGRVGGGNIAGVAVAITLGGPGAVFWMWAIALIGMVTSLFECSLAQTFKRATGDGTYRGGPARYIIYGLGHRYRWLAVVYAVCLIAAFALGFNAFQGNTVASAAQDSLGIDRLWSGIAFAALAGFVVYGGIKRIAHVADVIVPIMAIGYILMALLTIVLNITEVPGVLLMIVKNAFGIEEAVGGGMGAAIAQGVRRGLFSNEAGLGSVPNVAAVAYVRHPISQGIVQSLSVFIDTILICSCTAFVILLGDVYKPVYDNTCDLRPTVASDTNPRDEIIREFEMAFDSNRQECVVLIVREASELEKWTIAGYNDEADFRHAVIDDSGHELFKELKKESIDESKVSTMAASELGRTTDVQGVVLTQQSLVWHFGAWSQYFLTFAIILFAFSSIIYNYYLGENALSVFTDSNASLHVLRILVIGLIFLGCWAEGATSVFFFSDPMMGVLALVNLLAIIMLFPIGMRVLNDYRDQVKQGIEHPVFDPAKFPDLDLDPNAWKLNEVDRALKT